MLPGLKPSNGASRIIFLILAVAYVASVFLADTFPFAVILDALNGIIVGELLAFALGFFAILMLPSKRKEIKLFRFVVLFLIFVGFMKLFLANPNRTIEALLALDPIFAVFILITLLREFRLLVAVNKVATDMRAQIEGIYFPAIATLFFAMPWFIAIAFFSVVLCGALFRNPVVYFCVDQSLYLKVFFAGVGFFFFLAHLPIARELIYWVDRFAGFCRGDLYRADL